MRAFTIKYSDILRCPFRRLDIGHYNEDGTCNCEVALCIHCQRTIVNDDDEGWIDPEAGYDDENGDGVWRTTCDAHDTFEAEHVPGFDDGTPFPGYAAN